MSPCIESLSSSTGSPGQCPDLSSLIYQGSVVATTALQLLFILNSRVMNQGTTQVHDEISIFWQLMTTAKDGWDHETFEASQCIWTVFSFNLCSETRIGRRTLRRICKVYLHCLKCLTWWALTTQQESPHDYTVFEQPISQPRGQSILQQRHW